MTIALSKDSIDLGIVVRNAEAMLAFYRDTIGFEHIATTPVPNGRMERLMAGSSLIKLVSFERPAAETNPPGGPGGATGMRYWTVTVSNLDDVVAACERDGHRVALARRTVRPGVDMAMVEDPDGNWLELLELSTPQ